MAKGKNVPIKYTNREFDSIKQDLIEYAKRYYPDTYNDFSEASFGELIFDLVSYVGDSLSFYLDYQINESFMDTAVEFANLRKHARSLGYSYAGVPTSYGVASFFILVPSNSDGNAPDMDYSPTLKKGSVLRSSNSVTFMLLEDVDFTDPKNDIVEARYDETNGGVTHYAIKSYGQVSSGKLLLSELDISSTSFERFRRIRIGDSTISEVISVEDSEGNRYYEVDFLSQETVLLETTNPNAKTDGVRSIMKPFVTARRFIVEQDNTGTYLQFGFGSDDDDDSGLADPADVSLRLHARNHITDNSFDPNKLLGTDKLGISPYGTVLKVIIKKNDSSNVNISSRSLDTIVQASLKFTAENDLNSPKVSAVRGSLEVTNDNPIVGQSLAITSEEIKIKTKNFYATQNRAITKQDYEAIAYSMPKKFGSLKRVNVINDPSATNRKLAMYVVSQDSDGYLSLSNDRIKANLKTWLTRYKGINDQIEIFDAKIINFGINFEVSVDTRFNKEEIINLAIKNLKDKYNNKFYIGEPIYLTDINNVLSKTRGVIDVSKVEVVNKKNGSYSTTPMQLNKILSPDNTYYKTPKNVVMELKFPSKDIKGKAK
jgi:hypothetical protein